jgi:hypothetical protein
MPSVYDMLHDWARRTSTSFSELCFVVSVRDVPQPAGGLIYRLKHWPDLPCHHRTAEVYRTLSVMSHRPVNRRWILSNSRLHKDQLDSLLQRLLREGAVEAIDSDKFQAEACAEAAA